MTALYRIRTIVIYCLKLVFPPHETGQVAWRSNAQHSTLARHTNGHRARVGMGHGNVGEMENTGNHCAHLHICTPSAFFL